MRTNTGESGTRRECCRRSIERSAPKRGMECRFDGRFGAMARQRWRAPECPKWYYAENRIRKNSRLVNAGLGILVQQTKLDLPASSWNRPISSSWELKKRKGRTLRCALCLLDRLLRER